MSFSNIVAVRFLFSNPWYVDGKIYWLIGEQMCRLNLCYA